MTDVFGALLSSYYELLYRDKDYAGEADYVHSLLSDYGVSRDHKTMLELGCGTGRHAELMSEKGYFVHGIDRSADMLAVAQGRRKGGDLLQFSQGDATTLQLARKFQYVVSLFHVLSYQVGNAECEAMFRTAADHLHPGGLAVFDFWHGPGVLTDPPAVRVKRMADAAISVIRIGEPVLHVERNLVDVKFSIFIKDCQKGTWTESEETHSMRYFFVPELKWLCRACGLDFVAVHPWMRRDRSIDAGDWYGVIVCRKR